MVRYRLDLAYEGTGFHGYARQEGLRTVQGELESALEKVLGRPVPTAVAGRTDAGVHARGQVVSFDADEIDASRLLRSLNGMVGPEVAVRDLTVAEPDFHARFSARWRRYRYLISKARSQDPLTRRFVWHVGTGLDLEAMRTVVAPLVGEHDFSSFCRTVAGKSNVRNVKEARWAEGDGGLVEFWIQANAFCHQMVRSIVGFSYDVGRGFTDAGSALEVLEALDRSRVATVAPSHGLTLWEVGY